MQYEFDFSPDNPTTPYGTEGGLDSSTYQRDGKLVSAQRTGFIEVDEGRIALVKDGAEKNLPEYVVDRLEKPQPISTTLCYTQSSVWRATLCDEDGECGEYQVNAPADARNMTNGVHAETRATGTNSSNFEWVQVDLNGTFDVRGVVVGCDWTPNYSGFHYDEDLGMVLPDDPSVPGLVGGWGKGYAEGRDVQSSLDGRNWETLFNTGAFDRPIQVYPVNARARYLRIVAVNDYLAVTEFYAI